VKANLALPLPIATKRKRFIGGLSISALLLAGCSASTPSSQPSRSYTPSEGATPTPTPTGPVVFNSAQYPYSLSLPRDAVRLDWTAAGTRWAAGLRPDRDSLDG
jgi:uncharacterized lipoprotein